MHQHITLLSTPFNEVEGRNESKGDVLVVCGFHPENSVVVLLGVFELEISCGADGGDLVLLKFFKVVCELLATNPYFSEIPFFVNNFLAVVLVDA